MGMDLDTFFKMFFIKTPIIIPGQGSVLMTDYEKTQYNEGYNKHEAYVTDPKNYQPKETVKFATPDPTVKQALETKQKRVAAMSPEEQKTYWTQYDNAEQYRQKQAEQRSVFTNTQATATPQPVATKTAQPAPSGSPNPTPAPDYTAGPKPDSAYDTYEARRAAGLI